MFIWYYKEVFSAVRVISDPGAKGRKSIPCAIIDETVIPMIDNITGDDQNRQMILRLQALHRWFTQLRHHTVDISEEEF